jgi:hypothetical protein
LDFFPLMCAADKVWITELTLIPKIIRSVRNSHAQVYRSIWRKTHYDVTYINNNVSSEGLNRYNHKHPSLSYQTRWNISYNVCLNLQNWCYSICITSWSKRSICFFCSSLFCKSWHSRSSILLTLSSICVLYFIAIDFSLLKQDNNIIFKNVLR